MNTSSRLHVRSRLGQDAIHVRPASRVVAVALPSSHGLSSPLSSITIIQPLSLSSSPFYLSLRFFFSFSFPFVTLQLSHRFTFFSFSSFLTSVSRHFQFLPSSALESFICISSSLPSVFNHFHSLSFFPISPSISFFSYSTFSQILLFFLSTPLSPSSVSSFSQLPLFWLSPSLCPFSLSSSLPPFYIFLLPLPFHSLSLILPYRHWVLSPPPLHPSSVYLLPKVSHPSFPGDLCCYLEVSYVLWMRRGILYIT